MTRPTSYMSDEDIARLPSARALEAARIEARLRASTPRLGRADPRYRPVEEQRATLPALFASKLPNEGTRDAARMALHGLARTGNTILKFLDIPNRVFGNTRSVLQDIYERSEANLEKDAYEDESGAARIGETAVHLASAGVLGKALPAVFGANTGADTYEIAKEAGASEGEALAKGIGHGVVDTAIWTLGQGLASKYLPKAWQWLGRELTGATRGAASSVTSDAVLNSLGADISGEEMAKRAAHAAWMVPLLGMLKMGGKRREEAMSLLKKARPDLAGARADKVIETIEAEFSDPKSQKVALAWVARKGANLPDDTAQIRQALEVSSKVKGLDPMSRSPFEILSDPAYARYLPKPRPQDVKAFSNMKRYPMGVIGFDVSDDAAGRQATREMINAYMSPSSNPWCLATGKDAARLGELGPGAEGYWKGHSAVPKQIFFQEVDGKLGLTAFRATSPGGEGWQEYWDTSDAGYSGIPLKVKVPGDPMGRYRKMVFRPAYNVDDHDPAALITTVDHYGVERQMTRAEAGRELNIIEDMFSEPGVDREETSRLRDRIGRDLTHLAEEAARKRIETSGGEVQGTFEDIASGKVFKGDPFRDGRSQTWVRPGAPQIDGIILDELTRHGLPHTIEGLRELRRGWTQPGSSADSGMLDVLDDNIAKMGQNGEPSWVLVEDKVRTTENGITKFRTTKYADPTDPDLGLYEGDENLKIGQPVEIEESELVSPEWMRARGYDPENESDVRRMYQDLDIQTYGNGREATMAVVPTRRTYMQTRSGTPETVTYGPNGRDVVSVDFEKDGVPYREEFFQSGPNDADPSDVYHTIDYDELPHPTTNIGINEPSGSRLTRNPDSASLEVLNEVKWDEGLGSFVRTSGNRRWRTGGPLGADGISDPETRRRVQAVEAELAARLARFNSTNPPDLGPVSSMGPIIVDGREVLSAQRAANAVAWTRTHSSFSRNEVFPLYYGLRTEAPNWLPRREGWPSASDIAMDTETPRIIVEDRQPDGTWASATDRRVDAVTGETVELPPPPPELPVMAAKAGDSPDRFSMSRNFLATDKVPDTIFGIPVVSNEEDYTPEDLAFFREHPEAGGYYDMGEETPEDGSAEGAPTQADMPRRDKYPGKLNNPGNVEKRPVRRKGEVLSPHDRWAKFATPQDGLREMADAIRQIADVKLAEKDRPFTIRNFAEVYAPRFNEKGEPENDTDKYIRDISSTSGIDADAVLDRWNTDDMAKLLKTVVRFESGAPHSRWFTDDEYRTAARELEEGATD